MIRIFPFIFVLLWSSAFITTKPIIDNSDPFAALAFRFALVALGFFLFSIYSKQKILVNKRNFFESLFSGVLFHGFYLGGVFYSISIGMPTAIAALIVTLQPVLTNALSGPILNEQVSAKQWIGVLLGFAGAGLVLGFDIGSKITSSNAILNLNMPRLTPSKHSSVAFKFLGPTPMRKHKQKIMNILFDIILISYIYNFGKIAYKFSL